MNIIFGTLSNIARPKPWESEMILRHASRSRGSYCLSPGESSSCMSSPQGSASAFLAVACCSGGSVPIWAVISSRMRCRSASGNRFTSRSTMRCVSASSSGAAFGGVEACVGAAPSSGRAAPEGSVAFPVSAGAGAAGGAAASARFASPSAVFSPPSARSSRRFALPDSSTVKATPSPASVPMLASRKNTTLRTRYMRKGGV